MSEFSYTLMFKKSLSGLVADRRYVSVCGFGDTIQDLIPAREVLFQELHPLERWCY